MHKLNAIKNAKNRLPVPEAYLLTVLGIEQLDLIITEREEKFLMFKKMIILHVCLNILIAYLEK